LAEFCSENCHTLAKFVEFVAARFAETNSRTGERMKLLCADAIQVAAGTDQIRANSLQPTF
jgi:hypothetical protein